MQACQRSSVFTAAGLVIAAALSGWGQTTLGTIRGLATDPTAAVVPDVKIVVRNLGTNISRQAVTDATGNYEVTQLRPGRYEVTAEKAGFRKVVISNVLLETSATVRADMRIEVGEVTTVVNVVALVPMVNTESGDVASVRSHEVIEKMPINIRGQWDGYVYELGKLIPGAQQAQGTTSFAGGRGGQSNISTDGTSQRSVAFGTGIGQGGAGMEMTLEVRIQLANDKAEAALPAGAYTTTKSGTNEFHGSAFWYHSNSKLTARSTFSLDVPFQVRNNYGGSFGGPVRRNRTFFFATYERFPLRNEQIFTIDLPTVAYRRGDFSSLLPGNAIRDPLTGVPFPGNVIPPERLSQTSLAVQNHFYPLPNFGAANLDVGNWRGNLPSSQYKTLAEARFDHQISSENLLFVRVSWNRAGANLWDYNLPTIPKRDQDRRATTLTVSDNHLFSPSLINEFRFGVMREHNPAFNALDGPALVKEFGLQGVSWHPELPFGAPVFSFNNFQQISDVDLYQDPRERIYQVVNNLTWTKNRHVIKTGVELRWNRAANFPGGTYFPVEQFGQFSFSGAFTGFDYADFLLGIPQTAGRANAVPLASMLSTDFAFFVQDDWKITPKLTLNLGVRYEYNPPYHEENGNFFNFDAATGRLVIPNEDVRARINPLFPQHLVPIVTAQQAGLPERLFKSDLNNLVPRFGFAYRPFSDNKTVIRGAYGIYIDDITANLWRRVTGGPFISRETFTNSISGGTPLFQFPHAFPPGFGVVGAQSFDAISPDYVSPYIQQWNLTVERELLNMGFRVSYIGTNNRKLIWTQNVNQPRPSMQRFSSDMRRFPLLRDILVRGNGGVQNYHSLHIVVERKMRSGLYYQLGWTWAKNLTDCQSDSEGGCLPQDSYARSLERSNVDYTHRHRVAGTIMYDLPFGTGKPYLSNLNGVAKWLASGWTISSILSVQTGPYFSPTFSGFDVSNTNNTGTQRPDRIGNGNLASDQRTVDRWFDKAAFVVPGDQNGDGRPDVNVGRFGNAAPNILLGPGSIVLDAGLYKTFQISERLRAQLEGTFTNAPNHPNYGLPNTNIRSSTVGVIRSLNTRYSGGPRSGQVGLRIEF